MNERIGISRAIFKAAVSNAHGLRSTGRNGRASDQRRRDSETSQKLVHRDPRI